MGHQVGVRVGGSRFSSRAGEPMEIPLWPVKTVGSLCTGLSGDTGIDRHDRNAGPKLTVLESSYSVGRPGSL